MRETQLQRQLIACIERHTVFVFGISHDCRRPLLAKAMRQLESERRVSRWRHASGLLYWTRYHRSPLSNPSLATAVGRLLFCHSSVNCRMLTSADLRQYFPELFRHGLPRGHYIDLSGSEASLGLTFVDSRVATIARLAAKTAKAIDHIRRTPPLCKLMRQGRFEISWIVPTPIKRQRLAERLAPLTVGGAKLRAIAIPQLLEILSPVPLEQPRHAPFINPRMRV